VPLYSVPEAAYYLGVPAPTFSTWAYGYVRRPQGRPAVTGAPVVTAIRGERSKVATIPFVGLAEGLVLAAVRQTGVPLQRIRPALARLQAELWLEHVLASHALYTDGAEVIYDYAEEAGDTPEARSARQLVVARKGQHVFTNVIDDYLHRVKFASDGYAELIALPQYRAAEVLADPRRGFGQPIFAHGGAKLEDVLGSFRAGESLDALAHRSTESPRPSSRTRCVSPPDRSRKGHPEGLPTLFIDRSLGRIQVPRLLREAGLELVTLAEHYGIPQDEDVADVTWLTEVAARGWVALGKDERFAGAPPRRQPCGVTAPAASTSPEVTCGRRCTPSGSCPTLRQSRSPAPRTAHSST